MVYTSHSQLKLIVPSRGDFAMSAEVFYHLD